MPGMLTIDADAVRSTASALGNIQSQLKNDGEQLTWQLSTLESALQYMEIGATTHLRQAVTQLNEVTQLLQTAQTRLMQVVSDTLRLESEIAAGGGKGADGSGSGTEGGGEGGEKGVKFGELGNTTNINSSLDDGKRTTIIGVGVEGSIATIPLWDTKSGNFQNQLDAKFGTGAGGVGFMEKDGNLYGGFWGEATAASVEDQGLVGSKNLGWTYGADAKVLSADGFIGMNDDSIGAEGGFTLAEVDGHTGVDVGGVNVGVNAGIGLSLKFGFSVGKKTEIKLGPFSFGLDFG